MWESRSPEASEHYYDQCPPTFTKNGRRTKSQLSNYTLWDHRLSLNVWVSSSWRPWCFYYLCIFKIAPLFKCNQALGSPSKRLRRFFSFVWWTHMICWKCNKSSGFTFLALRVFLFLENCIKNANKPWAHPPIAYGGLPLKKQNDTPWQNSWRVET